MVDDGHALLIRTLFSCFFESWTRTVVSSTHVVIAGGCGMEIYPKDISLDLSYPGS